MPVKSEAKKAQEELEDLRRENQSLRNLIALDRPKPDQPCLIVDPTSTAPYPFPIHRRVRVYPHGQQCECWVEMSFNQNEGQISISTGLSAMVIDPRASNVVLVRGKDVCLKDKPKPKAYRHGKAVRQFGNKRD